MEANSRSRRSYSTTTSARASKDFRYCQPKGLGCLKIDDEVELGRLLNGEICRLGSKKQFDALPSKNVSIKLDEAKTISNGQANTL